MRLLSYLAPSLPEGLFEAFAAYLRSELNDEVELAFDPTRSGPRAGEHEPFTTGEVDIAFLCGTSYVWLTDCRDPAVELVGAAWVPTDQRSVGRPIYFGDVLAPRTGARHLRELVGKQVAYNDHVSLSGYHSLRIAFAAEGVDEGDVSFVRSGSHLASLDLLMTGEVDAAAVDSNVWRRCRREAPRLADELANIATLGPHPVQPIVARADLSPRRREEVRAVLLTAHTDPVVMAAMRSAELSHFVATSDVDFQPLRTQLADLSLNASMAAPQQFAETRAGGGPHLPVRTAPR